VSYWIKSYDLLFKVPFTRKYLSPDGVRSTDLEFQEVIERSLMRILLEDKVPYHEYQDMRGCVEIILDHHRVYVGPLQPRIPGI
jgi:hypothetical protein